MKAINTVLVDDQMDFKITYNMWLTEAFSELTELEINEMEEDFFKSSTVSNRIISLKPVNNQYYQPIIGA